MLYNTYAYIFFLYIHRYVALRMYIKQISTYAPLNVNMRLKSVLHRMYIGNMLHVLSYNIIYDQIPKDAIENDCAMEGIIRIHTF